MKYLYERIEREYGRKTIAEMDAPQVIVGNLKHQIRPYQKEAFNRFILWQKELAAHSPPHLLFNMATGSGKTLIMAGLMLALYQQGHRNFLFFVNSTNIIRKTKDNFVNAATGKYLFTERINIDGREVSLKEVNGFEESSDDSINIKFTTIQQLHADLRTHKENGITLEDFAEHKLVLIADEAHHLNVGAKEGGQTRLPDTWEGTAEAVLNANIHDNLLLEFTATVPYGDEGIDNKYTNKILCRYDLKQFRADGYSKEINLIRSDYDENERIMQALILNIYRQQLAAEHDINLKPVILFKAQRTVAQSEANKAKFHQLVDGLTAGDIKNIRATSKVDIVQKAFRFFDAKRLSESELAARIKANFAQENCVSANNEEEKEQNQIRLNTLEDDDNPLRAVFAVQKLNEGWDVLNLFDIVRLYETRDTKDSKPGKTTISEAQLIGRGARYFPFALEGSQDRFTRKFDRDSGNDLKILEELYYHTRDDSRYISELKIALEETGIYEDDKDTDLVNLALKEEFKRTTFYKTGEVVLNEKTYPDKHYIIRDTHKPFTELTAVKQGFEYRLASGGGASEGAFDILTAQGARISRKSVPLADIQRHVVAHALSSNPFYRFDNLANCFGVNSMSDFMDDDKYLGKLRITFAGTAERLEQITNRDRFLALRELLAEIEGEVKKGVPEFKVSELMPEYVRKVFTDKQVRVKKAYSGGQPIAKRAKWYAYNDNFGTPEEMGFVELFDAYFEQMKRKYKDIYLIRNERQLKITNSKGNTFEPDFLLFCKPLRGKSVTYQIFIEPKGEGYIEKDRWKEDFLNALREKREVIKIDAGKCQILGLPFYTGANRVKFENAFVDLLALSNKKIEITKDDAAATS